jgi:hypothetical protein
MDQVMGGSVAKEKNASQMDEASYASQGKAPTEYEQLISDLNAIVDDVSETDAPRMLRRMIERIRRR